MSTSLQPSRRGRGRRRVLIAAVVLVPLAFAGLIAGALPHTDDALAAVPAAVVNQDQLVYQKAADGSSTPVFAGRQLVTELTGGGAGFDWTVSNAEDARAALAAGEVDAVLTIPADFSSSILSLSSGAPHRAELAIRTDDANSYLTGVVAQAVGGSMVSAFGKSVTERYIAGMSSGLGELGASLGSAADGADSLAQAAGKLSGGLSSLSTGVASTHDGAASLSQGIDGYTRGVDGLSTGLARLRDGAAGLTGISSGVASYTGSVAQLAQLGHALAAANAGLQAAPTDPVAQQKVASLIVQLSGALDSAADRGGTLSRQTSGGIRGIQDGIAGSAAGAAKLAAGSAGLRTGASNLAGGLAALSSGVAGSASGAGKLATGTGGLAAGLKSGADRVPTSGADAAALAAVAADPVALTVTRDHELRNLGQVAAIFFVPLGLWIGALATFLVLRPLTRAALASTAATGTLVWNGLARAAGIALAQALLLVGLLHLVVGVPWSALGATLGFAILAALAFTAFHFLLTVGFGRAGLVVSLFALAIQVTSTGGLYPLAVLAAPFQWVNPLLPLTYAVTGMQGILAAGPAAPVAVAAAALAAFGLVSALLSVAVLRAKRRARGFTGLPAIAGNPA